LDAAAPFTFAGEAMLASFDFLAGEAKREALEVDVEDDDDAPLRSNFLLSEAGEDGDWVSSTRDLFEDEDEEEDEEAEAVLLGSGLFLLLCSDCSEDI
jgi:hypothetical protein